MLIAEHSTICMISDYIRPVKSRIPMVQDNYALNGPI